MKLLDVRFMIEQEVGAITDQSMILWANQVNADIGVSINVPAIPAQIAVNTTDLEYTEPAGIKVINRMWLQSDRDSGNDREFTGRYRRYGGKLIFANSFPQSDTLNIDYFKQMTYFTDIDQNIDIDDRHGPLYASYGVMKYYKMPQVMERLGEDQARQESQLAQGMYMNMRQQALSLYALGSDPITIDERW